jgi:hypothetical protein
MKYLVAQRFILCYYKATRVVTGKAELFAQAN